MNATCDYVVLLPSRRVGHSANRRADLPVLMSSNRLHQRCDAVEVKFDSDVLIEATFD